MNLRRRRGGTLRTRVTLVLVTVLLFATVVTGVAAVLFVRGSLTSRLDQQLSQAGGRFSASLEHGSLAPGGSDGDEDNTIPGQSVGTVGVRLVGGQLAQSAVVGADGRNRTPDLSASDARAIAALPVGGSARSVDLAHLGDYRLQAVAGRDGDVQVTGLPLRDIDDTLANLVTAEVVLFAVVIAAGAIVTTLLVRRTLRPLEAVTATAKQVSELPLTDPAAVLPTGLAPEHTSTEVDELRMAFEHMLDHIRHALVARDATEARLRQFVADASHELRTPLATIRAHTDFAVRAPGPLPSDVARALDRIDGAGVRMSSLVDDLLLLARLDAGQPVPQIPVDLTAVVLDVVVDARPLAPDHSWRLQLPEDEVMTAGDERQLHQVVSNLVSNVRHHTPSGTTVTVGLTSDTAAGSATVTVADDGPGIPEPLQHALFDRFVRGDAARSSGHGSSGLGLAIARGVVEAHGGALDVASRPGATTFTVRLPLADVTTATGSSNLSAASESSR